MRTRLAALAVVTVCLAGILPALHGQEEAAPAPTAGEPAQQAPGTTTNLWSLWKTGGLLMWPLGLLSVATAALSVYGFLIIRDKKMLTPDLVPLLQDAMGRLQLQDAVNICNGSPSLLTNVLNAGLQRISDGVLDIPSMEKAMEEASVEETSAGLKAISYLSITAQVAPMVGLLGTVSGMIKAFDKIGKGAMGKPEILAGDIGEALITTAFGLMIGIPAMFLYFYLKSRYTSNVTKLGRVIGNLTHHLVSASRRAEEQGGAPEPEPDAEPAPAE
jgi:biopolymer transport protein ExbB